MRSLGIEGHPSAVSLSDPGPWGSVMAVVLDPEKRQEVVDQLFSLSERDPRTLYDELQGNPIPDDWSTFACEYLFLQRLSFSGKAVGIRDGRWASTGFNASSAYGLPGTDRFGPVKPMIPSLISVLEGYRTALRPDATVTCERAPAAPPEGPSPPDTLVYIDPPYSDTTSYPNGSLSRDDVVELARAWRAAGATVMVSEGEPLQALVDHGWQMTQLYAGRSDTSPFRGKQQEWVTYARGTAQPAGVSSQTSPMPSASRSA